MLENKQSLSFGIWNRTESHSAAILDGLYWDCIPYTVTWGHYLTPAAAWPRLRRFIKMYLDFIKIQQQSGCNVIMDDDGY